MSYDLSIRNEAVAEFTEAFVWYEERQDGLGKLFENAIKKKLDQIIKNPYHYKADYKKFH